MWLRIRNERIRICPECRLPCLRINDDFYVEDDEDSDPLSVCRDCVEDLVSALPREYFQALVEEDNRKGQTFSPELVNVPSPTDAFEQLDADEISEEVN